VEFEGRSNFLFHGYSFLRIAFRERLQQTSMPRQVFLYRDCRFRLDSEVGAYNHVIGWDNQTIDTASLLVAASDGLSKYDGNGVGSPTKWNERHLKASFTQRRKVQLNLTGYWFWIQSTGLTLCNSRFQIQRC
jgi:hypothetical protein